MGVDGHGRHKAVCEGSIVTEISVIQPSHHTNPILLAIKSLAAMWIVSIICMMSKLVSTFSIHHAQNTILRFDKELHSDT